MRMALAVHLYAKACTRGASNRPVLAPRGTSWWRHFYARPALCRHAVCISNVLHSHINLPRPNGASSGTRSVPDAWSLHQWFCAFHLFRCQIARVVHRRSYSSRHLQPLLGAHRVAVGGRANAAVLVRESHATARKSASLFVYPPLEHISSCANKHSFSY